ncbi:protein O-mannosyl-transferase TMTC2 [Gadus morhua]|uniref:dolichyl-phosphate-mannose--protein mannosyltransferase n=1 Tax=Gadus morhua TaxID=8049 RepID=A0A8C5ALB2_GADMO|nr:protein O-mannosyl-transferase TMTC2-like [Gadus morhua]
MIPELACTAVAVCLYLNTLDADFCYDDSRAIKTNQDLLPETPWTNVLHDDFWGTLLTHSGSHKSYRPLCTLSFRLNHALGGLRPWGYHLVNVGLHGAVTGLFTALCGPLLRGPGGDGPPWSLLAGLLFASHPAHTEAVAGVVGRADVGAALFFLLSVFCYARHCGLRRDLPPTGAFQTPTRHCDGDVGGGESGGGGGGGGVLRCWAWMLGSLLCAAASMLWKEQGVTVLAVSAAYDLLLVQRLRLRQALLLLLGKKKSVPALQSVAVLSCWGVFLLSARLYWMGNKPPNFSNSDNPAADSPHLLTRTLTFLHLPAANAWLLLFPDKLSFDWSMDAVPLVSALADWRNLQSLAFYFVYVLLAVSGLRDPAGSANGTNGKASLANGKASSLANGKASSTTNGKASSMTNGKASSMTNGKASSMTNGKASSLANGKPIANGKPLPNGKHIANGNGYHPVLDANHNAPPENGAQKWLTDGAARPTAPPRRSPLPPAESVVAFSLSLLTLPFLPATNLFFYVGFVIAERVLYIPSMGFSLLVALGARGLYARWPSGGGRALLLGLCGGLVLLNGVRTVQRNSDWSNEENLYRSGISVNPAKAWGNLGNVLKNQAKMAEAERAYRNALFYRGNMADMLYNLGLLLQETERFPEALHYYRLAISSRPTLASAYLNTGIVLMNQGSLEEARRTFSTCAEIPDENLKDPHAHKSSVTSCLYNLGKLLHEQGLQEEALSVYQRAVHKMPRQFAPQSLFNMMGEAYMRLHRLEDAAHWYRESLRAKPDHIPAHLTYGKLLAAIGQKAEAEKYYLRAIQLDPTKGNCYMHYGQFLLELSRLEEAAAMAERAAELDSGEFDVVFSAAHMLRQASLNEAAERQYERAASLRPDYPAALMNLGAILHLNGKLPEAEAKYLRALRLKPDDAITRSNLRKLWNIMERQGLRTKAGSTG